MSASKTRNFLLRDPVLDWLNLYGKGNGFVRDDQVDGYDERTDFTQFIFSKGHDFEAAPITREEWAGTCAVFDAFDVDGDGRVTPQELAAGLGGAFCLEDGDRSNAQ